MSHGTTKKVSVEYRFPLMYKSCFSQYCKVISLQLIKKEKEKKRVVSHEKTIYLNLSVFTIIPESITFSKKKNIFPYTDYMFYLLKSTSHKLKTVNT